MAQNKVEYHIQAGALFTFKVASGQTVKIGQLVELSGDRTVKLSTAGSEKVVGVVFGGTVGVDGVNVGFSGDAGDVVTVVILKPFVYLTAGATTVTAGDTLKADANGNAVTLVIGTDSPHMAIGMAITGASAGGSFVAVLR